MKKRNGYYSSGECYRSALSNLLVCMGDTETAQKAFDAYSRHRLVGWDGMHTGTATVMLRELTGGIYDGILKLRSEYSEILQSSTILCENAGDILSAISKELDAGNIVFHSGRIERNGSSLYWVRRKIGGHWVVPIGNDMYIDNGTFRKNANDLSIIGVLDVRKVSDK